MMLDGTGTLSGAAQSLLTLLFPGTGAPGTPNEVGGKNDVACNFISLQPDGAGSTAMFVGASSALTTALYGVRLPAPAAGVPPAPYVIGAWSDKGPTKLSNIFIIGTAADKIHVLYCYW